MKENSIMRMTVTPSWHNTGFVAPVNLRSAAAQKRAPAEAELEKLKIRLLRPILEQVAEPDLCHRLQLAANEALADALKRPFPIRVLPFLLEQKVREVQQWFRRQQQIWNATRSLIQDWEISVENDSTFAALVQA